MNKKIKMIFGVYFISLSLISNVYGSEAVGFFSKGELRDGVSIVESQNVVHKLFLQREKFYSTKELNNIILNTAQWIKSTYPDAEKFQVGDLSSVYGGPAPGHASHQNGLDFDAVYLTKKKKLQKQTAGFWEEEFVLKGKLSANFDLARNFELFKYIVHNHPVRRIFVDEVIKKNLCLYARDNNLMTLNETKNTLKRLRIQALHANHFHVRMTCPKDDLECVEQAEVPNETGCETLVATL